MRSVPLPKLVRGALILYIYIYIYIYTTAYENQDLCTNSTAEKAILIDAEVVGAWGKQGV